MAEGDNILYGYGAGYFASIPDGAQVLVQLDGSKDLMEGFLPADGEHYADFLNNSIQAISYQGKGAGNANLDVVLFANTLTNKVHQRDEFNFISNTAFASVLTGNYSDVARDAWYADSVAAVTQQGLMNGVSSANFDPTGTTTRSMMATVLWRMEGQPQVDYLQPYTDVETGSWYTEAVRWAASEKIVTGYSDTVFAPNDTLTREQLVTMLWRYAGSPEADKSLSGYPDAAAVGSWASDAMAWAVDTGIITGTGTGALNPQGNASRAEVATILVRFAANNG